MRTLAKNIARNILWKGALKRYRADAPYVVAVGGSVGKTSAKEAIATVLSENNVRVVKTLENLATDFGVPLSLLGYSELPNGVRGWLHAFVRAKTIRPKKSKEPVVYVLEYSVDSPGDTDFLTSRIRPNAVVMTAITPVHMEQFKTVEAMQRETVALVAPLHEGEKVYANWNDPVQRHFFTKEWLSGRSVHWYGVCETVPKRQGTWATALQYSKQGLSFQFGTSASTSFDGVSREKPIETSVIADYQLGAVLAAAAIAEDYGIDKRGIAEGIAKYQLPAGRGRIIPGRRNITIIDDSANSSPDAVLAGLKALKQFASARKRRHVAIIGAMNELGEKSAEDHERVAIAAAQSGAVLLAVGPYSQKMVKAALEAGAPEGSVMGFAKPEQLMRSLDQITRRSDVVFVKASQNGMFLERVVKLLMAEPSRASELLVRQGKAWARRHS